MSKFYCNVCEEEVELKDGLCPKCRTDWDKVVNNELSNDAKPVDFKKEEDVVFYKQEEFDDKPKEITEKDIDNNINFFLKWASIVSIVMGIIASIIGIIAIVLIDSTGGYSLILLLGSGSLLLYALIIENCLKWKAYMLYTNKKKML